MKTYTVLHETYKRLREVREIDSTIPTLYSSLQIRLLMTNLNKGIDSLSMLGKESFHTVFSTCKPRLNRGENSFPVGFSRRYFDIAFHVLHSIELTNKEKQDD